MYVILFRAIKGESQSWIVLKCLGNVIMVNQIKKKLRKIIIKPENDDYLVQVFYN